MPRRSYPSFLHSGEPCLSTVFQVPRSTGLFTAAESRALDRLAIERHGIPGIVSDEARRPRRVDDIAAALAARRLRSRVVCGRGNNAGDGYIVAGCARSSGTAVQLIQLGSAAALTGDAALARDWAVALGVAIDEVAGEAPAFEIDGAVIVDALIGTGASGDVRPGFARAIEQINAAAKPVLSLDIPSGLCADTGRVLGSAVRADVTVTFIGVKRGLVTGSGRTTPATSCSIRWACPTTVIATSAASRRCSGARSDI